MGSFNGFTAEERAAMKEHAAELKAAGKAADGERTVLEKIATFEGTDRTLAERIHAIVTAAAPHLVPRLWYGQPAYAKDDKVLCFFQPSGKFRARYCTLGFNDVADLDDGTVWPTGFAITQLTADDEQRIAELVKRAAG